MYITGFDPVRRDEALVGQLGEPDHLRRCQSMDLRNGNHIWLAQQKSGFEIFVVEDRAQQSDLYLASSQGLHLFGGNHLVEDQIDAGIAARKFRSEGGRYIECSGIRKADRQSTHMALRGPLCHVDRKGQLFECNAAFLTQAAAGIGQGYATARAIEQLHTKLLLELGYLLAERRLGYSQSLGHRKRQDETARRILRRDEGLAGIEIS